MTPTLTDTAACLEVLFQEVGDDAVLPSLDDAGTCTWHLLESQGGLYAAQDAMLNEYDVEPARLEGDLLIHIAQLADAGLVTLHGPDHAPP
jgi:hypothetical protein